MTQREGAGHWTAQDAGDQSGRVAVITGANSGLGLETARVLAAHRATVVLAGRDPGRTAAAPDRLRKQQPDAAVQTAELDLASLESVRKAAADLTARFPRLDLLINNAGVMFPPYSLTRDGYALQFGTNHLGHFALTGLLMPSLLTVPRSRVVTLSSNGHRTGRMNLANLLFTYELQRRLAAANAQSIALAAHPGTARTDLTRHMSAVSSAAMSPRFAAVNSWWVQDAKMGALPTLRAATDPAAIGGTYYGPDGFMQLTGYPVVVTSSTRSLNKQDQRRLWVESEQLTGITYPV